MDKIVSDLPDNKVAIKETFRFSSAEIVCDCCRDADNLEMTLDTNTHIMDIVCIYCVGCNCSLSRKVIQVQGS